MVQIESRLFSSFNNMPLRGIVFLVIIKWSSLAKMKSKYSTTKVTLQWSIPSKLTSWCRKVGFLLVILLKSYCLSSVKYPQHLNRQSLDSTIHPLNCIFKLLSDISRSLNWLAKVGIVRKWLVLETMKFLSL